MGCGKRDAFMIIKFYVYLNDKYIKYLFINQMENSKRVNFIRYLIYLLKYQYIFDYINSYKLPVFFRHASPTELVPQKGSRTISFSCVEEIMQGSIKSIGKVAK